MTDKVNVADRRKPGGREDRLMSEMDEERSVKKTGDIVIGEDLSLLSVEELAERISA